MNKYYIKKIMEPKTRLIYGFCLRFDKIEKIDDQKFLISDLHFLGDLKEVFNGIFKSNNIYVTPDKKSWSLSRRVKNQYTNHIIVNSLENIYEFEDEEEALLMYEVMD